MRREFERKLMEKLSQLRQDKLEQIGAGALDIEQYRYWTGYLKAFADFAVVLTECKKREDDDDAN